MSKFNGLYFLCCFSALTLATSHCAVPEPNTNFPYNFPKLMPNKEDFIIVHESTNDTIRLQLCASLRKKCNNQDGYAICLVRNGGDTEMGIGKFPPKIVFRRGQPMFDFEGDNCTPETKYTVQIILQYDINAKKNFSLHPYKDKDCNIIITWYSMIECMPRARTNCTVVHKDLHYDLSPLTRNLDNYVIRINNDAKSPKIVLNVCYSIIQQSKGLYPLNVGACLEDPQKSLNKCLSLGEVQKSPFFKDDNLQIEYKNGAICKENVSAVHIETTIIFKCRLGATETIPEYEERENCHYYLIWYTAAACSIESLRNYSAKTAGQCTVTNPVTNFTYNLQPLMNKDFTVTNKNDTKYIFRVCEMVTDICGMKSHTGICDPKNITSLGQANANLKWQQGGPYLNYTNGDYCQSGLHHYTVIGFFCGPEESTNLPVLMEQNSCQTVIHWNTNLTCEKRLKCATDNDDEINLTPLIKSTNNYVVKANDIEFHINVCRPLVVTRGLTCAHGSAACKVSLTSQNDYVNEVSLGFPEDNPILNKDLQTVLRYVNGSKCPENPTRLISSNFTFVCDNNNQELPVYKRYIDCTYVFEWNTSIACGAVMGDWSSPCIIKDNFLSYEYDLSLLYKEQQIHYVKTKQSKYGINICGGEKYCNGSAVCHEGNGYGSLGSVIFDYNRHDIKLKYSNGSKCNNNSYTSEVRFICNESIGVGAPRLLLESQCSAEFEWHTEVICAKHANSRAVGREDEASSSDDSRGILTEKFSSSHVGIAAVVVSTVIAVLAALIYFRNPERRTCFRSWTSFFFSFRGRNGHVRYCRVDTSEEARLLLDATDPTQCQTDSDDDLLHA